MDNMPCSNGTRRRVEKLRGLIEENDLDLAIVSDPKSVFYFTGFRAPWFMYPTHLFLSVRDEPVLLIGEIGKEIAETKFGGEIVTYANYDLRKRMVAYPGFVAEEALKFLAKMKYKLQNVGVEFWSIPQSISESLKSSALFDLSQPILDLRVVKEDDEIEALRASCELNDFALSFARDTIAAGKSEVDVYATAHEALTRKAGTIPTYKGDFISGERTLRLFGLPTSRILKEGENFILDTQVEFGGYWSDITRTYVVGKKPSKKHVDIFELLKSAMQASEKLLKPGNRASDVYQAGFEVIEKAGYGKFLPHHMGHGLGLDPEEAPFFIPGSQEVLQPQTVCAVEPGIYLPGFGGIRIENNYLITTKGFEKLTKIPLTLI